MSGPLGHSVQEQGQGKSWVVRRAEGGPRPSTPQIHTPQQEQGEVWELQASLQPLCVEVFKAGGDALQRAAFAGPGAHSLEIPWETAWGRRQGPGGLIMRGAYLPKSRVSILGAWGNFLLHVGTALKKIGLFN